MSFKNSVILVSNYGMGKANNELQLNLIVKYFELLQQYDELPDAICFYTEGVRLAAEGSPILIQLKALEDKGVRLILCSTCLNTMGLTQQVKVGVVGGMTDIIEAQSRADKVISI
jgi:hypothetical protein